MTPTPAAVPPAPASDPLPPTTGALAPTPHPRGEADLRLLLPTIAAWCLAALLPDVDARYAPPLLGIAGLAALLAAVLLFGCLRRHRSAWRPGRVLAAAVLLTAAAATACTVLHTADLHRGPLPALARTAGTGAPNRGSPARPRVIADLTITGDPRTRTTHARGTAPGQTLLTVAATADEVAVLPSQTRPADPAATPAATRTRTRTPVTVLVRAADVPEWQDLLPSTRLAVEARVLPAREGSADTGAVLLAEGSPRLLARPGTAQRIAGRLRAGLRRACQGLSPDVRALLPGLVIGDTSAMPEELDEAFRSTDLVHLTAVSGANLSIVLAVLLGTPGRVGTAERGGLAALLGVPLRVSALLGTVLTLAFVTLCRPDPSVLRAAATGLVGLLALATGRPRQAVPALAGGVLVLLLADPFLARSYGFLLSSLATLGLLTLGRRWTAALSARGWPHHLAGAVAAAASAQALCAPAAVLLAPRVSLVGVPCNMLAELAVTPATLLGFGTLVVAPVWPAAARVLAELAALPTEWLAGVARFGAALPGAELAWTPGWPGAVTLSVAIAAACWAAPLLLPVPARAAVEPGPVGCPESGSPAAASRGTPAEAGDHHPVSLLRPARRRPWWRGLLVVAVLTIALIVLLLRPPALVRIATGWPPAGWRLVMCSVGQGDLVVLPVSDGVAEVPDTAVVVDAGPDPAAADACLRGLGITRVALVVLTHFHADHSEGLPGVLRNRAVGAVETTTLGTPPGEQARVLGWAAAAHVPVVRAVPGEHRTAGPGLSWDVLWPAGPLGPATPGANNASIALLVRSAGLRLALLGDLEPPAQAELLSHARPGPVDVLKVAHHGSANQDWALAEALHPRLALISAGLGNPYGHPAARTVDRLRALGATVLRTDRSGDLAVLGDTPAALHVLVHPHEATGEVEENAALDRPNPSSPPDPDPAGTPGHPLGRTASAASATWAPAGSPVVVVRRAVSLSRPLASRRAPPAGRRSRPAPAGPSRPRGPPGRPATGRPRRRPHRPGRPGPTRAGRAGGGSPRSPGRSPRPRHGRRGRATGGRC
ncbi:ComEC/Rec2 family competence protein [Kitasatospora sp. NPDC052896]|uniref:ComEC/Rec2 family competence protein n=1 Tax=Kitasatospora sp. NPDC052896 TaxID=3364061 RepID=UPI0037C9D678